MYIYTGAHRHLYQVSINFSPAAIYCNLVTETVSKAADFTM